MGGINACRAEEHHVQVFALGALPVLHRHPEEPAGDDAHAGHQGDGIDPPEAGQCPLDQSIVPRSGAEIDLGTGDDFHLGPCGQELLDEGLLGSVEDEVVGARQSPRQLGADVVTGLSEYRDALFHRGQRRPRRSRASGRAST